MLYNISVKFFMSGHGAFYTVTIKSIQRFQRLIGSTLIKFGGDYFKCCCEKLLFIRTLPTPSDTKSYREIPEIIFSLVGDQL